MKMERMERIPVSVDHKPVYDIVMSNSFEGLRKELEPLGVSQKRVCIVTDSNVAPLYLEEVKDQISQCAKQVDFFVIEAGEEHKNLDTVRTIYEFLIERHYDRKDLLAALGGGVVGDLCGFAAATYLRGIGFIQIPTTLLSQVDSSIGGKTGVDFLSYKNMVGAFHMPRLVYTNVSALKTLPPVQFASGMGEVLKHGLIRDQEYFQWLAGHTKEILGMEPQALMLMIQESNRIKREVVELDPKEQKERATLNFGHTLGHAIEKQKGFSLPHGICVALGALAAMRISKQRGLLSEADVEAFRSAMEAYSLPQTVSGLHADEVLAATKNDKKMEAGVIKFILLNGVGYAYIDRTVTIEEMKAALLTVLA